MSGESGPSTLQETALRIAKSKPWVNLEDYENLIWAFDLPKLGQPGTIEALVRFIREHSLEVLIIDPLYLALAAGEIPHQVVVFRQPRLSYRAAKAPSSIGPRFMAQVHQ